MVEQKEQRTYQTYEDFPSEDLYTYAGLDVIATSELLAKTFPVIATPTPYIYSKQGKLVKGKAPAILDSLLATQMPLHEFIIDLEINGIKYDKEKNVALATRMVSEVEQLEESIFEAVGHKLDLNSGKALGEFLYDELNLEVLSYTKKGEPAVDGEALDALNSKYQLPFLASIRRRNDIASAYRTFIRSYVSDFVKSDGRLHPNYNLTGTSSGRISGDRPNLTQLPRTRYDLNIRSCYTVDDGYVFLCFDFSSCEVKVLGAISKDPSLLRAIREGKDFHSYSAAAIMGIPYDEFVAHLNDETSPLRKKYKEARQNSKALTFSILYGASVAGVAASLGVDKPEAERLIGLYFKEYPLIQKYVEDSHNMAKYNQFVLNTFGQRKMEFGTLNMFKKSAVYNACLRNAQNCIIQGSASTLGLYAFTHLNEALKKIGGKSICTVNHCGF